jgi:proline iminopeptidase
MTAESAKPPASRRTFLAGTGAAAAGTAAAALLGGPLAGTARAAGPVCPPGQFAPVPKRALGPPVNADGYFVGQIKGDRGGWYSWDRLDNGGRPSATRVHPEWQDLAPGDYVKYWTRNGPVDAWEVAALEPNRFLGLRGLRDLRGRQLDPKQPRPSSYTEGLWAFLLNELPGGRTRLVISGYQTLRPRWLERFRQLLALRPRCLADAGPHAGRTQTQHRTSGPGTNANGPPGKAA